VPRINNHKPTIRHRRHKHEINFQVDCGPAEGNQQRWCFKIKGESTAYANGTHQKRINEGILAFTFNEKERVDAQQSHAIIDHQSATLKEAAVLPQPSPWLFW